MWKIILLLLIPLTLSAQIVGEFVLTEDASIVIENKQLHEFFDSRLNIIDTVDGNTWVCLPETVHLKKHDRLLLINGSIVVYQKNGKEIVIGGAKADLVQYDFKTGKKLKIKNGSLSSTYKYPKNPKKEIENRLKKDKGNNGH